MYHDHEDGCNLREFIMSRSRAVHGQTKWSACSARMLGSMRAKRLLKCLEDRPRKSKWDHNSTHGVPGYFITAEEQCRFYYKGKDGAGAVNKEDDRVCQALLCTDGERTEATGPPLEGTACGGQGTHWCKGGDCVPIEPTKWGGWQQGLCESACIADSVGFRVNKRQCLVLEGYDEDRHQCLGIDQYVSLCEDMVICGTRSCGGQRQTKNQYATQQCRQKSPIFRGASVGAQAPHDMTKPKEVRRGRI